jgi:nucleoside-diphosphate-sugar epimerase
LKKSIFVTGSSGFIGNSLLSSLSGQYEYTTYNRHDELALHHEIIIHLAGKAHDLKTTSIPDEYYRINTELTKSVFDAFIASDAKVFITLSSVKAVADKVEDFLTEEDMPHPTTHYGKSKLLAEQYILAQEIPNGKRIYVLRPCMVHGPGNRGNLNLLYSLVSKRIPWPLGAFDNLRSFCSIDNLIFIFKELIEREDIPSGVYNVADDIPISTNEVISILASSQNRRPMIWKISKRFVKYLAKIGNSLELPLNEERLQKLTDSYIVSNKKLMNALGKPLPISSREGLLRTFKHFDKL